MTCSLSPAAPPRRRTRATAWATFRFPKLDITRDEFGNDGPEEGEPVFRGLMLPRLVATLLVLAIAAIGSAGCQDAQPRNLLLISLDTLRADHLGCYGYERPTSPFLDGLAAEGIVFERAYAAAPWTLPSHASLFTGLYPSQHGVKNEGFSVPKEILTLPQALGERGFATAAVVSAHFLAPRYGLDRGFERYVVVPTNPRHGGAATTVSAHGLDWLAQGNPAPVLSLPALHGHPQRLPRSAALRVALRGALSGPGGRLDAPAARLHAQADRVRRGRPRASRRSLRRGDPAARSARSRPCSRSCASGALSITRSSS